MSEFRCQLHRNSDSPEAQHISGTIVLDVKHPQRSGHLPFPDRLYTRPECQPRATPSHRL